MDLSYVHVSKTIEQSKLRKSSENSVIELHYYKKELLKANNQILD